MCACLENKRRRVARRRDRHTLKPNNESNGEKKCGGKRGFAAKPLGESPSHLPSLQFSFYFRYCNRVFIRFCVLSHVNLEWQSATFRQLRYCFSRHFANQSTFFPTSKFVVKYKADIRFVRHSHFGYHITALYIRMKLFVQSP